MLLQKPPRVHCPRLNSAYRQAKALSGLGAGQALQLPVVHNDSQVLSKLRNCLPQRCAALAFAEEFFWCRSAVGNLRSTVTSFSIHTAFIKWFSRAALAQQH
jgi:hypothetical protein